MDWLKFMSHLVFESDELVHIDYDADGLTVLSDLDGDGDVDRISRMEYGGRSATVELDDWGANWGDEREINAPERGSVDADGTGLSPGWGAEEWG